MFIQISEASVSALAPTLTGVQNLDLRGCKQLTDAAVHHIVTATRGLRTLALANCPALTDAALAEIATYCPDITYVHPRYTNTLA